MRQALWKASFIPASDYLSWIVLTNKLFMKIGDHQKNSFSTEMRFQFLSSDYKREQISEVIRECWLGPRPQDGDKIPGICEAILLHIAGDTET